MRSTDLLNSPCGCTNYLPEKKGEGENEKTVYRCCLTNGERERKMRNGMCGNDGCPFFKPVGKSDTVRRDGKGKTCFVPLTKKQAAHQMSNEEYFEFKERKDFMDKRVAKSIEWLIIQLDKHLHMTREEVIEQIEKYCEENW